MKGILDLRKTPRGRAILFFGAYFFFFLLLIIMMRFSNRTSNYNYGDNKNKNEVSFDSITNNNYAFTYNVRFATLFRRWRPKPCPRERNPRRRGG